MEEWLVSQFYKRDFVINESKITFITERKGCNFFLIHEFTNTFFNFHEFANEKKANSRLPERCWGAHSIRLSDINDKVQNSIQIPSADIEFYLLVSTIIG